MVRWLFVLAVAMGASVMVDAQVTPPTKQVAAPSTQAASSATTGPSRSVQSTGQASAADAPALTDYKLGTADKVRIIVFNEETLSGEFIVSDGGTLSMPLIGSVQASGRTPGEVTKDIEEKLANGYLRDPRVSMDVLTYRPFYILGEVSKPGEYPFSNNLTVFNAVARAEGFTYRANKRKVFIKRLGQTVEQEYRLTPEVRVYPGDTVRIGERFF